MCGIGQRSFCMRLMASANIRRVRSMAGRARDKSFCVAARLSSLSMDVVNTYHSTFHSRSELQVSGGLRMGGPALIYFMES